MINPNSPNSPSDKGESEEFFVRIPEGDPGEPDISLDPDALTRLRDENLPPPKDPVEEPSDG